MNIKKLFDVDENVVSEQIKQKRVNLSFDDKATLTKVSDNMTIVKLVSYFSDKKFKLVLDTFGLTGGAFIESILKTYGYVRNENAKRWEVSTVGFAVCDARDEFDAKRGRRVAMTKAKAKAFKKGKNVLDAIFAQLAGVANIFLDSYEEINHLYEVEESAIPNVINTGYCDPAKN